MYSTSKLCSTRWPNLVKFRSVTLEKSAPKAAAYSNGRSTLPGKVSTLGARARWKRPKFGRFGIFWWHFLWWVYLITGCVRPDQQRKTRNMRAGRFGTLENHQIRFWELPRTSRIAKRQVTTVNFRSRFLKSGTSFFGKILYTRQANYTLCDNQFWLD